ncbi:recombinase family protein [Trichocoleus sp. DQ-A3]|uniref:recombinase family protein n=1 Tax=Cyanophyceae TaxID=3028117 RepID=UPI0016862F51|nr:recombinase family protein [Coleofasciculus sp. FACHB-125]
MGQLKLYRVAIYCRVSTDEQSCERRERDLVSYVQLSGLEIVAVYKETASEALDLFCARYYPPPFVIAPC